MASDKRIRLQDEKGTLSLLAVNRKHDAYTSFRTALLPTERDVQRAEEAEAKEAGMAGRPRAVEAFRFGAAIRPFLPEGADTEDPFSHPNPNPNPNWTPRTRSATPRRGRYCGATSRTRASWTQINRAW